MYNKNYKKANGAHQVESNCVNLSTYISHCTHELTSEDMSLQRKAPKFTKGLEERFQEWNTRSSPPRPSSKLTDLYQHTSHIKRKQVTQMRQMFLVCDDSCHTPPPLPFLFFFFVKHQVVQWPWALKDII